MPRRSRSPLLVMATGLVAAHGGLLLTAAAASDDEELARRIAAASIETGEQIAETECLGCHTFNKGAYHKAGPNLWDVVGRPIAAIEGFRFSEALDSRKGETWTFANMDKYLAAPDTFAPGTNYPGIEDASARARIIAFLRSLSDDPKPLPDNQSGAIAEKYIEPGT